jgi:hypothetical protein
VGTGHSDYIMKQVKTINILDEIQVDDSVKPGVIWLILKPEFLISPYYDFRVKVLLKILSYI